MREVDLQPSNRTGAVSGKLDDPSLLAEPGPQQDLDGVEITSLDPADGCRVRSFCLEVIAEAFGYGYQSAWHRDLDQLTDAAHDYLPARGGRLLTAFRRGELLGCGGLRELGAKPQLASELSWRYPDPTVVGSIWRVYVAATARSFGLGSLLASQLEAAAIDAGYRCLYLHTSGNTPRSVRFWERCGYRIFRTDTDAPDSTVHLDKQIC